MVISLFRFVTEANIRTMAEGAFGWVQKWKYLNSLKNTNVIKIMLEMVKITNHILSFNYFKKFAQEVIYETNLI